MARTYLIDVDLAEMATNRAGTHGREGWSESEIREWLRQAGLESTSAGWIIRKLPSELLRPSEYRLIDRYTS